MPAVFYSKKRKGMKYVANNILNTRIVLNNKTNEEWVSSTYSSVIPLKGEICIYSDLRKIKIGDGVNTITDLTFANLTPEEVQSLIQAASHSHSNKTILDGTTASFTTELLEKLNDIATGAEVNQNAFSKITVGSTTIEADTKTDTLTFISGNNITLTPDATGNSVTIASIDTDTKVTNTLATTTKAYITGTTSATTNTGTQVFDTGVYLDTTAGKLVASTFSGNLTGNVTGNVSGSSGSCTGNSATATALTTSAGSATQPIYFSDGKPVACTYSLGKSVPSDAKFTDTVYTHPTSAGNKHIPSGGSSGQILGYNADGTAAWTNSVSDLVVSGSFSQNRRADSDVGNYSAIFGYNNSSLGSYCISGGYGCSVSGSAAIALGYNATANTGQLGIGHWGNPGEGTTSGNASSKNAFVIGNGSNSGGSVSLSNAFRVTYAGAVIGKAAYQSTGADFAELREWSDGNPNNEDRRGYFVTMDGMNIKIASPGDYICGIISANPSVIGNNDEDWMGRYVFDDFGAFVYEDYEETDPETGEIRTYKKYKENPEYDPTREYAFRADRPEWDYVGLCGVIHVRDDGTCQVNGFCKCAEGGIATASERGYRVLERVNDHIVKVLFYLTGETF